MRYWVGIVLVIFLSGCASVKTPILPPVKAPSLEQRLADEWRAEFFIDEGVYNVWQTRSVGVTLYDDRSCRLKIEAVYRTTTLDISDDGLSHVSGTGGQSVKNDLLGECRVNSRGDRDDIIFTFPGRNYYAASFEPFIVVKKPGADFTDPTSRVKIKTSFNREKNGTASVVWKGRAVRFSKNGEVFFNPVPLIRSGAASGDGRLITRHPVSRQRIDNENYRRESKPQMEHGTLQGPNPAYVPYIEEPKELKELKKETYVK